MTNYTGAATVTDAGGKSASLPITVTVNDVLPAVVPVGLFNAPTKGTQAIEVITIPNGLYRFVLAGQDPIATQTDWQFLVDHGFLLVPTIRWMHGADPQAVKPSSKAQYQDVWEQVISMFSPYALVCENEAETRNMWQDPALAITDEPGYAASYAEELSWAVEVGRAHGIPVADSGWNGLLKAAVYQWMKNQGPDFKVPAESGGSIDEWWTLNVDSGIAKTAGPANLAKLTIWMSAEAALGSLAPDWWNYHHYVRDRSSLTAAQQKMRVGHPEIAACLKGLGATGPILCGEGQVRDLGGGIPDGSAPGTTPAADLQGAKDAGLVARFLIAQAQSKSKIGLWTQTTLSPVGMGYRDFTTANYG